MGERHRDAGRFLDALLAAVRTAPADPEAEGRAVAAYRAARERGAHGARTRRRDDWRRPGRRPPRVTPVLLLLLVLTLTLGGGVLASVCPAAAPPEERGHPAPASSVPPHPVPGGLLAPPFAAPARQAGERDDQETGADSIPGVGVGVGVGAASAPGAGASRASREE